jgi:hypothetical protein
LKSSPFDTLDGENVPGTKTAGLGGLKQALSIDDFPLSLILQDAKRNLHFYLIVSPVFFNKHSSFFDVWVFF